MTAPYHVEGWPCATAEEADRLRRIFRGDLTASPGRALFAPPSTTPGDPDADEGCACAVCGERAADGRHKTCRTCRQVAADERARHDGAKAPRRQLTAAERAKALRIHRARVVAWLNGAQITTRGEHR